MSTLRPRARIVAGTLLCLAACKGPEAATNSSTTPASTVPGTASPSSATIVMSSPAASASAAPAQAPQPAYAPLPRVAACKACPWKGTGCVQGSDKECALDPAAFWEVEVVRAKPKTPWTGDELFCVGGAAGQSCGKLTKKREQGSTIVELDPKQRTATLSTAEVVGLETFGVSTPGRNVDGAIAPRLVIDAALFDKGALLKSVDGDEAFVTIKPGAAPKESPKPIPTLLPPQTPASKKDAAGYARATELAKTAMAIDAKLASYRRELTEASLQNGLEVRVVGFFDGDKLVKAYTVHRYNPPMLVTHHYFSGDRVILQRAIAFSGDSTDISTTFFDEARQFWSDGPDFDPAKDAQPAKPKEVFSELRKAAKTRGHRFAEGMP